MLNLLQRLGVATAGFDRWELHFTGAESASTWWAAGILLLALLLFLWPAVRPAPRGKTAALLLLRLLAAAILLLALFQPTLRLAKAVRLKNSLAVLMDRSASMGLGETDHGATRLSQALEFVARNRSYFDELEQNFQVRYFAFDETLRPLPGRPDATLAPFGKATHILEALADAVKELGSQPLGGVLVLTDGADNGRLRQIFKARAAAEPKATAGSKGPADFRGAADPAAQTAQPISIPDLADLQAPVHTVLCGRPEGLHDLAIAEAEHDEYGFVHNPFVVKVKIRSAGQVAAQVPLTLKSGDQVLVTREVKLDPQQEITEVKLDFTPRKVGEFLYTLELPVFAGEASDQNNRLSFPLRVLRDKVRVLYIVGNPSWDERFLRLAMKRNPSVDLVSFYILREYGDNPAAPQDDLALIPFPVQKLFTEELPNFDLVIFQNFFGMEYIQPSFMPLLRDYVKVRGGSLLVIGGIRALLGGNAFNAPLEEILPLEMSPDWPNFLEGDYSIYLTPAGRTHPITRLSEDPAENEKIWKSLPALSGINKTLRPRPGALVLAEHPFARGADGNLPVIAITEAGAGRCLVVATDSTWHWNLPAVGEGQSNKPYQIFWDNALRWLLQDPEMKLLSLTRDKGRYRPGEDVHIALEVLDESYQPSDQAKVKLEAAEAPAGVQLAIPEPTPAGRGKYDFILKPPAAGGYRLRASAELNGRSLGHDEVLFEVAEDNRELLDVALRPEWLQEISKETGGVSVRADEGAGKLGFKNPVVEKITGTRDLPLWDNLFTFLFALAPLGLEWFLRRRWGLS